MKKRPYKTLDLNTDQAKQAMCGQLYIVHTLSFIRYVCDASSSLFLFLMVEL